MPPGPQRRGDHVDGRVDHRQVGDLLLQRRGDADDERVAPLDLRRVVGEGQPSARQRLLEQAVLDVLDRAATLAQPGDAVAVGVVPDHPVSRLRRGTRQRQPDVAETENAHISRDHEHLPRKTCLECGKVPGVPTVPFGVVRTAADARRRSHNGTPGGRDRNRLTRGRCGMWLPHLADVAWMTQRAVAPRRRARAAGRGGHGASCSTRGSRTRTARSRHGAGGGRRTSSRRATPRRCSCTSRASPPGAPARPAWQQDRVPRPAGRSTHLPELDLVVWRFPEDPRLAALPDLVTPRRAAGTLPPAVRDVLGLTGGSTSRARPSCATSRRRASTLRLETARAPARRPSSPSTSPTGRSPTSRPATRRCGPASDPARDLRIAEPLAVGSGTTGAVDPRGGGAVR